MNRTTEKLHEIGQSIWLDNITHRLLASGTLLSYIRELSVTGLTSNPTIFDHAIKNGWLNCFSKGRPPHEQSIKPNLQTHLSFGRLVRVPSSFIVILRLFH
jgi:hypothetical protein